MGKTNNAGTSGKVGNVIYYEYRGKPCVRSVPGKIKQTEATKASASLFGLAIRMSRVFRRNFKSVLPNEKDKRMLYGFNNVLLQWLRHTKPNEHTFSPNNFFIDQFQFNEAASLPSIVKLPVTATFPQPDTLVVNIPELLPGRDITAPARTRKIYWHIGAASGKLEYYFRWCQPKGGIRHQIEIPYGDEPLPAQVITLPFRLEEGALTLVAIGLVYEVEGKNKLRKVKDKRWKPAGIIGSCFGKEPLTI